MVAFCQEQNIPHEICGKVVVATEAEELPQLDKLYQRDWRMNWKCGG